MSMENSRIPVPRGMNELGPADEDVWFFGRRARRIILLLLLCSLEDSQL